MIRSSHSPQARGHAKVQETARPRALAKVISQGHYKDRGPVEPQPNQTQDSLLNGAYSLTLRTQRFIVGELKAL